MIPSDTPGKFTISGAVIGKHFYPTLSTLFDEEWTPPNGDNPIWSMSNDSSGNMADSKFCNDFWCEASNTSCYGSCSSSCVDKAGKATDSVVSTNGGSLIMTNIRYAVLNCNPSVDYSPGHGNISLIGYNIPYYDYQTGANMLSGNTYNPVNSANKNIFPIDITKDTYIEISLDDMSISPAPPASNYAQAYQAVWFGFTDSNNTSYALEFSTDNHGIYNYFLLDLDTITVGNIYEMFAEIWNITTPPPGLKLNYIQISQQTLWNLPCDTEYTQRLAVDLIRVGELTPTH